MVILSWEGDRMVYNGPPKTLRTPQEAMIFVLGGLYTYPWDHVDGV